MIPFGVGSGGGATSLSPQGSSNYRRIEPVPIKNVVVNMPPPRNPSSLDANTTASSAVSTVSAAKSERKIKVQDLNAFFVCFLCEGYKIEATTINECMHSCK